VWAAAAEQELPGRQPEAVARLAAMFGHPSLTGDAHPA
jgi:hypothetical protein